MTSCSGSENNLTGVYAGDPEIRAFDGNTFEFEGNPGSFYEALADDSHQVSVHLKVGVMWDHNGTYMQGVGMKAHDQAVIVTLDDDDCLQGEGLSAFGRLFLISTMRCKYQALIEACILSGLYCACSHGQQ